MPAEGYGEQNDKKVLRRELRRWELRFHGEISNQKRLIRLKHTFALKHGFPALLALVNEVVLACVKERQGRDDWDYWPAKPRRNKTRGQKRVERSGRCRGYTKHRHY